VDLDRSASYYRRVAIVPYVSIACAVLLSRGYIAHHLVVMIFGFAYIFFCGLDENTRNSMIKFHVVSVMVGGIGLLILHLFGDGGLFIGYITLALVLLGSVYLYIVYGKSRSSGAGDSDSR
jgi:hypothetical protein